MLPIEASKNIENDIDKFVFLFYTFAHKCEVLSKWKGVLLEIQNITVDMFSGMSECATSQSNSMTDLDKSNSSNGTYIAQIKFHKLTPKKED